MDKESRRQGACDRCRGQKLRCIGSGRPIFNATSRFLRNEIPCDRCKRAKVECYSVRPAPRRSAGPDKHLDQGSNTTPAFPENPEFPYHHGSVSDLTRSHAAIGSKVQQNDLRSDSIAPHNAHQNDGQSLDPHILSTLPAIPNESMAYMNEDEMEGHGWGLEMPSWTELNLNTCQDPVKDTIGDHNMVDLMERASSEEWNSDQIDLDVYADRIEPSHLVTPKARKLSSPYNGMTRSGQARRPSQMTTPAQGSTKFFLRKLSKFNEMLLNQKNKLEDATAQKRFESNRRSFGQTLNHCQEFFSILKGIKYSCSTSGSNGSSTKSGRLFQADGRFDDLQSQTQTDTSSCSYASTTSLSGRSSSTSSAHQSLDIPTLFSILFCYTYLLQSYEEVFTSILDAVTGPVPTIPPTLSGLCVDGFELDVHNTLQLDCLINLSYNLLEKIETILIGSAGYSGILSGAKAGLLGDGLFTSFMEELYEPEEQTSISHVNEKREVRAKRLIREIQAALKVIDL